MSKVIDNIEDIASIDNHIGLSGITAYHLLQGNLAVDNTVTTQGFNTTLYTGNGSTQSINTGIDMSTQWGNDVSEKFGGLVWIKSRSNAFAPELYDTIRGINKGVSSNSTMVQWSDGGISQFNNNGFGLNNALGANTNAATYASWNFQTTHRVSGTTNHGKAYTCHYNPFTGFTIVKYEGSGIAGHEIPHHLGRKLGFLQVKGLSAGTNWSGAYRDNSLLMLNLTDAETTNNTVIQIIGNDNTSLGASGNSNTTTNQYIMYGWANSYIDKSNKLIGNYEVGVYQGTGASGNKVVTRGKPAWVMIKRMDSTGSWAVYNNQSTASNFLCPNLSQAESSGQPLGAFNNDGFTINNTSWSDVNASGGQYLYIVAYDTNSNGGGSYYPRATDTTQIQLNNAIIPLPNGIDTNGIKVSTVSKNETVTGVTLTQGKNYLRWEN